MNYYKDTCIMFVLTLSPYR